MTNFKTTVRADCAVSACSPLPPSIHPWNSPLKTLPPWPAAGERLLDMSQPSPQVAGFLKKATFPCLPTLACLPYIGFFFFFFFKFILFIYFWLRWLFVVARGLSLVAASGGYFSLWWVGFSLQWLLLLWSTGSRHVGFSSCVTQAQ